MSNVASTLLPFLATMSKQRSTLLPKTATMSNDFCVEISSFRQSRTLLRHCCPNGNIVKATGNKVACCFDNVTSTLLLVWTGLKIRTWYLYSVLSWTAYIHFSSARLEDRTLSAKIPLLITPLSKFLHEAGWNPSRDKPSLVDGRTDIWARLY